VAVPDDIQSGSPDPSLWGEPIAALSPEGCDIDSYFFNHNIIFGTPILPLLKTDFLTIAT
jgi:hypothetical protein